MNRLMIRGESQIERSSGPSPELHAKLHQAQVDQTMRLIPLLLVFHGIAATAVHVVAGETIDIVIRELWPALCAGVVLGFGGLYLSWQRGALKKQATKTHGFVELLGLAFGIVWSMPVAAYAMRGVDGPILPLIAISLTVMGVATLSLLRSPIAIIVFLCLMTAALARSAWMALGTYGMLGAGLVGLYGLVLLSLAVTSHRHFLRSQTSNIKLRRQRDFLALLLNDFEHESHDWLWETDKSGRLVYASPRLADNLSLTEDALLEGFFRAHLASAVLPNSWPMLEAALISMEDFKPIQVRAKTSQGERTWLISGKALQDDGGFFAGFRGVGRDVTEQKNAERQSVDSSLAAEAASAAKSRFLSVMSHELRTPIHSIVGFAELLTKDRDVALNDKARREFTVSILDQAKILQGLINDMLDATRLERGTIKLVEQEMDASEIAELAVNACASEAENAKISIVATLLEGVEVMGDTARLKQALTNILSNAIKFSQENGIVHVEMQKMPDDGLRIEIRDAGIGISRDDIEKLFQPFAQADDSMTRRFNGLGLGLAIARKIMDLHDGTLNLTSSIGAGTTATLILPPHRVTWRTALEAERLAS